MEAPLQLVIAPLRAVGRPRGPSCLIEVDGRRAGYIGRNPLSGNLEYWVESWARGGVGRPAITAFLRDHRAGDRPRRFHVSYRNDRSRAALLRSFEELGWHDGAEFDVVAGRFGWEVHVAPGPQGAVGNGRDPAGPSRGPAERRDDQELR
jgi:hypothetical protein